MQPVNDLKNTFNCSLTTQVQDYPLEAVHQSSSAVQEDLHQDGQSRVSLAAVYDYQRGQPSLFCGIPGEPRDIKHNKGAFIIYGWERGGGGWQELGGS